MSSRQQELINVKNKLIVGLAGGPHLLLGLHILQAMATQHPFEYHFIISPPAQKVLSQLTSSIEFNPNNFPTYPFKGSLDSILPICQSTEGLFIIGCGTKTLSGLVTQADSNLILKTAKFLYSKKPIVALWAEQSLRFTQRQRLQEAIQLGTHLLPVSSINNEVDHTDLTKICLRPFIQPTP